MQTSRFAKLEKAQAGKSRWWRQSFRVRQSYQGQSLVEFAISLPFLIFLLLALVELGFLVRGHLTVSFAVREGVRSAAQAGDYQPQFTTTDNYGLVPTDKRVAPGNDGDSVMVANISSSLQEELKNAYLLMTFRADSSDYLVPAAPDQGTRYGIASKADERWGVFWLPPGQETSDDEPRLGYYTSPFPHQRIFQHIDQTQYLTIPADVGGSIHPTVKIPYVQQGWLPGGVMDGTVFSYTVSLPFNVSTNPSQPPWDTYRSDLSYTAATIRGVVPPANDPYATSSNQLLIWHSTSPCPNADPMKPAATKYWQGVAGGRVAFPTTPFCGRNDPRYHVTKGTTSYGVITTNCSFSSGGPATDKTGACRDDPFPPANGTLTNGNGSAYGGYSTVGRRWKLSFENDPWFPTWRVPGGTCDVSKPNVNPGEEKYYNLPSNTPNWIGVRVDYKHYYLTNWFLTGPTLSLTDKAVKIVEPVQRPSPDWKGCGVVS